MIIGNVVFLVFELQSIKHCHLHFTCFLLILDHKYSPFAISGCSSQHATREFKCGSNNIRVHYPELESPRHAITEWYHNWLPDKCDCNWNWRDFLGVFSHYQPCHTVTETIHYVHLCDSSRDQCWNWTI